MPLPKLPTRPAAILDLTTLERTAKAPTREIAEIQPDLDGLTSTQPVLHKIIEAPTAHPATPAFVPGQPSVIDIQARSSGVGKTSPAKKAVQPNAARSTKRAGSKPSSTGVTKLFVLDTNVLLHDPSSLFRFEEHDVFLPMMTLEELDHQKKGMTEVARNARQVSRSLDTLVGDHTKLDEGLPLDGLGHKDATGRLYFQTKAMSGTLPSDLPMGKADNQILSVVRSLQEQFATREVVLVSKDINMRLKARALAMAAEDYFNDHVLEDSDLLYTGVLQLPCC
jgi:PhoH-like ATPase